MGFRWTAKNLSPIGIDFGSDSIKLLQVLSDEPPRVVASACADIPADARKDAEARHRFVTTALRDLLRDAGFRGKRVVASIPAAHTYIQHVRLTRGEAGSLEQQVEAELRGKLPLDPSMMVVRHVLVGDVFADGASKQELICLAASRDVVMRSVGMIRAAGYEIVGMHCEPMAILQSFSHLFRRNIDGNRTTFFIDIGAATTKALIAHGPDLVFAKTIHVGGDDFARRVNGKAAASLGTTPDRTQNAAQFGGAPTIHAAEVHGGVATATRIGTATATATAPSSTHALPESPGEMLEALVDELQLCAGYHASVFQDRPLEKIVFLGGESRNTPVCQRIAQALRLPAQLGDPLARLARPEGGANAVGVDLGQPQPGWAVPLGLCLLPTNL